MNKRTKARDDGGGSMVRRSKGEYENEMSTHRKTVTPGPCCGMLRGKGEVGWKRETWACQIKGQAVFSFDRV